METQKSLKSALRNFRNAFFLKFQQKNFKDTVKALLKKSYPKMSTLPNATYQYTKAVGTSAYIFGYAPMSLYQLMSHDLVDKAPMNTMFYATQLSSPTYRPFPGPNVDTLYNTAWLDLKNTPIMLKSSNTTHQNRWLTIQLLDIYTNTFKNIPGLDKNEPSRKYLLVGPNWCVTEHIPDGVEVVRCPTNIMYVVCRVEVKNNDLDSALGVSNQIKIKATYPDAPVLSVPAVPSNIYTSLDFFTLMLSIINYNPIPSSQVGLIDEYKAIGLNPDVPFNPATLTPNIASALQDAINTAYLQILPFGYAYATGIVTSHFWTGGTKLGVYGNEYIRRAYASYSGLAANIPYEQFYMSALQDGTGQLLNGTNNYNIHFDADKLPRVDPTWGFWSIALYLPNQELYPNSENKYAVGSNTGELIYNVDGSLDIYLQNIVPSSGASNWIPTPLGQFRLVIRFYSPELDQISTPTNVPTVNKVV